jgi:hypothetical protein
LLLAILEKEIIIKEFISIYDLGLVCSIAEHSHLIVESNKPQLSITRAICHVLNLLVDRSLEALHPAHVCQVPFTLEELVRTVTEFHQRLHLVGLVALDLELALDRLRAAH